MRFIGGVIEKLQRHPKRVVFPEGTEPRVLQAARQFYSLRLGAPILLGDRTKVKEAAAQLNVSLEGVRIINPAESEDLPAFVKRFEMLASQQRYSGKGSARSDAVAKLLRRDDGGDAPVRWADFGNEPKLRQRLASAVPNHQSCAAGDDRFQLHGDGSRGHEIRRGRRADDG